MLLHKLDSMLSCSVTGARAVEFLRFQLGGRVWGARERESMRAPSSYFLFYLLRKCYHKILLKQGYVWAWGVYSPNVIEFF